LLRSLLNLRRRILLSAYFGVSAERRALIILGSGARPRSNDLAQANELRSSIQPWILRAELVLRAIPPTIPVAKSRPVG
jgi:hypothetical protein